MRGKFGRLLDQHLGGILFPLGFSREYNGKKTQVFWRRASEDVFHFVSVNSSARGNPFYEVHVFAQSPRCYFRFEEKFPDLLSMPFDSYLDPDVGVGFESKTYCKKNEDAFLKSFRRDLKPALLTHAIPHLDAITTVEELLPFLDSIFARGPAFFAIGQLIPAEWYARIAIDILEGWIGNGSSYSEDHLATLKWQRNLLSRIEEAQSQQGALAKLSENLSRRMNRKKWACRTSGLYGRLPKSLWDQAW